MNEAPRPGIYLGNLRHRRSRPRAHAFTYPVFMALLDVDRIDPLCRVSPFLSRNRWNWASFDDRDHLGDPSRPLRERVAQEVAAGGGRLPDGPLFLLTHLRYFGYCFNPVSYYYACGRDGRVEGVLVDIRNTFGQRQAHWLDARRAVGGSSRHYEFDKLLHVSPFLSMDCRYRFSFSAPGRRLGVHVKVWENGEPTFDATLGLERQEWSRAALHRALVRHPFMTATVVGAIHFEALRLWAKRVPVFTHPDRRPGKVPEPRQVAR